VLAVGVADAEFRKANRSLSVTEYNHQVTMTWRTAMIPRQIRGRTVRHWTPRYIRARLRQALYQRGHPDSPWLTPEAIRLLDSMLRPSDIGAEFGSGRSTLWLARRCAHLTSVEHDQAWHATVSAALAVEGITHVDYQCHPRDEPDASGNRSAYARVAQFLGDESIDFALVDGLYRDYVTLFLLPKIRPGGMLIVDNVNRYLPSPTMSPASLRPPAAPATAGWGQATAALAGWRRIWTSSGVWDTAIFVKTSGASRTPAR
jgi:predicted O-methyltransferase YrrM